MQQTSLLAHLFPYFKGSQEDVATSSLNYIVSSNSVINQSFVKHIGDVLGITITDGFQFRCQASGENGERPDMAGYDENGNERILWESKFYAALTINQPNEYLRRLLKNNGLGLVFVCPEIRQKGLWAEIKEIMAAEFSTDEINDHCIIINNSVRLGITTWRRLLNQLEEIAVVEAPQSLSDIKQLQGYCQQMDSDAFIPFKEEELGIDTAVKEERHYRLIDSLVEALKTTPGHTVSLKGLRATPVWAGYRRYLHVDDYAVAIEYDTRKWKDPDGAVTPYWIRIKNSHWEVDEICQRAMMKIDSLKKKDGSIALIPRCYVALSEIVEDMKKQIFAYINIFDETKKDFR